MNKGGYKMIDKTKYVEFTAKRNNVQIKGFVDIDEIDDNECLQFYNHQGFEGGYRVPTNPYNNETELNDWIDYEYLISYLAQDDLFIQYLFDFQNEYYKTERPGYTLIINPDLKEK